MESSGRSEWRRRGGPARWRWWWPRRTRTTGEGEARKRQATALGVAPGRRGDDGDAGEDEVLADQQGGLQCRVGAAMDGARAELRGDDAVHEGEGGGREVRRR